MSYIYLPYSGKRGYSTSPRRIRRHWYDRGIWVAYDLRLSSTFANTDLVSQLYRAPRTGGSEVATFLHDRVEIRNVTTTNYRQWTLPGNINTLSQLTVCCSLKWIANVGGNVTWSILDNTGPTWSGIYAGSDSDVYTVASNSFDGSVSLPGAYSNGFRHMAVSRINTTNARYTGKAKGSSFVADTAHTAYTASRDRWTPGCDWRGTDGSPSAGNGANADFKFFAIFKNALTNDELVVLTESEFEELFEPSNRSIYFSTAGATAFTLTGEKGTYTYSGGTGTTLLKGNLLTSAVGSYDYQGVSASTLKGSKVISSTGSYDYQGVSASTLKDSKVISETGNYDYQGVSASTLKSSLLAAGVGSYDILGQDATLTYTPAGTFTLTCETGTYNLSGQPATLLKTYLLNSETGSYILDGKAATLTPSGSLTLTQADIDAIVNAFFGDPRLLTVGKFLALK